ncbi:ATP-binding protein [Paenibacillus eucommiae]|uniref:histidine kinase n=1 Tax=Paenibacillus eucommiae TaxID=1355755 RepID=A0ABS4IZF8_9BACL|nr:ATP-binding protein [Paenibacillus eucommiae]MBP1992975.1 signal transduction histidine kinase [Paenibacillus eucommiae]
MKNRKILTLIMVSITLLTTYLVLHSFRVFDSNTFAAKNGVLSLLHWDRQDEKIITLDGEWDFYPDELIVPSPVEDVFERYKNTRQSIPVPAAWDRYRAKNATPYGTGTYRLIIHVPKDDRYGVKLNTIRNANKVYLNGEELGSAGVPSKRSEEYRFDYKKYVVLGNSKDKQIELVILVANYDYAVGGIVSSLHFGLADQILAEQGREKFTEAFLISGYLLFSFIYFTAYLQHKRKFRYELYFSLFSLAQAIHISTINERWIYLLFPELNPSSQLEIQAISLTLFVLFFLLFVYHFFNLSASRRIVTALSAILGFQALAVFVLSMTIDLMVKVPFPLIQLIVSGTTAIGYVYIFIMLLKAYWQKTDESDYVLIVVFTFAVYGVLLAIVMLFEVNIEMPSLLLFLIMVMSLALLLSHRSQQAYNKAEKLSNELLKFDRIKDEFLVKTSHELGTPLHGIMNLSQSLLEGVEGPLKRKQQENVILIHSASRRLAGLVKDLSFISKIKQGEVSFTSRPIEIRIVEEVLAEIAYVMPPAPPVQLINKIPENLPLVHTDEQKLKQVFFNLIYNAIKFTKQGTITISAQIIEEQMHISVKDTGPGIAAEYQDLIFTTFYQVESSRIRESEGLGLGLSITKKIVESAGGRIWVTSEIGKGSCFTFTIPLATNEQLLGHNEISNHAMNQQIASTRINNREIKQSHVILPAKVKGSKPYTILVVDDEPANLKVLINMLHSLHYSVMAVGSGQEALDIIDTEKVDLLILDLMMPHMTGYEVCKEIRQKRDLVDLPVIILTAAGQLSDLVVSFQLGANDYLQKPVNLKELEMRIESLLLMKKSAQDAVEHELSYFYAQITPHFLYNTLNAIIALSWFDQEKTQTALEHLSTYFRGKLDYQKQRSLVPLEEEIQLVKAYLAIEQLRFEERLHIEYNIDETIQTYIPSMTLQPLVENAVHHGISKRKNGGTLRLTIEREQQHIKITIEDNGVGIPLEKQQELLLGRNERLGFTNPYRKLSLIKGARFQLNSEMGKGTTIIIHIPAYLNP